jgi:hypothetical protein
MSARALEFVEEWVSEKIDAMDFSAKSGKTPDDQARAKALAAQCVNDAQGKGIPQSEIDEAFDDLAVFIAGEIDEARNRGADRSGEAHPGNLVEDDDARVVEEEEDDAEKDAGDAKDAKEAKGA